MGRNLSFISVITVWNLFLPTLGRTNCIACFRHFGLTFVAAGVGGGKTTKI